MNYYDDFYSRQCTATPSMGEFPQTQFSPISSKGMQQISPMDQQGLPTFPSGVPAGGMVGQIPNVPAFPGESAPITMDLTTPMEPSDSLQFVAGFLRTQIGRNMRVEFLIGTGGPLVDRLGTLLAVGTSYIILRPYASREMVMCDLYSIKFVTIFP